MLKLFFNYIHEYCDAPRPWALYFQDSAAPQFEGLIELHEKYIINICIEFIIVILLSESSIISLIKNCLYLTLLFFT
jgi:cytochrome c oxidase subunit 2